MTYELRRLRFAVGAQAAYLRALASSAAAPPASSPCLPGCWVSEIGRLNQVVLLLDGESSDGNRAVREALPGGGALQAHDRRSLETVVAPVPPPQRGNIYELRTYRLACGSIEAFIDLVRAILPFRQRFSPCAGMWVGASGPLDEVVHLWPYPDLNQRMERRAAVAATPEWQDFLRQAVPLVEHMDCELLLPTALSALA